MPDGKTCEICDTPDSCLRGAKPCDLSGEFHVGVSPDVANGLLRRVQELENQQSAEAQPRTLMYQRVADAKIVITVAEMDRLLFLAEHRTRRLDEYYKHVALLRSRAVVEEEE